MVSRIFFSLQLPDKQIDNLYVDIKQTVGDKFEGGTLEVGRPQGLKGNLDYLMFRDAVESYYRSLVGSSGRGIRVEGASDTIMMNSIFEFPMTKTITVDTESGGW